ncbi:hypothetical protein [Paenibacillus sp. S150]|uniref:hypothetical protein n=1 Tax=Paenibacillus sp. S150 TaxID=2749826 RepID=UPI001C58E91C|nr:hypothetical protein [Paenibacillus sp. S150]MBW4079928.1 hypothetical protein [Paenibacillus sp. S150]
MIIRYPGLMQNHVDHGLHYHLDLGPNLAELMGREPMPGRDGQGYAPALQSGQACGRESLIISQCAHVCQRSVRFGQWLYIRSYHDGYHLFDTEMLYNPEEDGHEQHNVAASHPAVCREAVSLLNEWHDQMMRTMPYDTDPLWTVMKEGGPYHAKGQLKEYVQRLEETGRSFKEQDTFPRPALRRCPLSGGIA